ncbi:MAG TPA: hypothetical protein PJ994_03225 [Tepidiformaceae bacterium]|nr:hypothetical protein [Tepidiformaceae bacterium]
MLFEKRFWTGIADGSVTVTFRRWKKPVAAAGRTNRAPGGIVLIESVTVVGPATIPDEDARRAGYASAAELIADLRGSAGDPLYRVQFRLVEGGDPRDALASIGELSPGDVEALSKRLARLDSAAKDGPWTMETLRLIERLPRVRAQTLADELGREKEALKLDIRKLKNLGLTLSLETGYEISPRGRAFLSRV